MNLLKKNTLNADIKVTKKFKKGFKYDLRMFFLPAPLPFLWLSLHQTEMCDEK